VDIEIREFEDPSLVNQANDPNINKNFVHVEEKTPIRVFSPMFLATPSFRRAGCKDVQCFGLYQTARRTSG
jgi:hypothetical protein